MHAQAHANRELADSELKRRVSSFLAGRNVPGLRRLDVEVENGHVTLRGRVQSFYEKQLCQDCCRRVAGVVRYVDQVDVSYAPAAVA